MDDVPTAKQLEEILGTDVPTWPDDHWLDSASGRLATIELAHEIIARQDDPAVASAVKLIVVTEREDAYQDGYREGVAAATRQAEEDEERRARVRQAIFAGLELREPPWWRRLPRKVRRRA